MGTPTPAQVARDPEMFAAALIKIEDKSKKLIPFRHNPIQRDYLKKRTPFDLVVKPRQVGFTTMVMGELFRFVSTRAESTLSLSNNDDNTSKLRLMVEKFYAGLPQDLRPARQLANAVVTTYPVLRSEMWIQTAGGKAVGRSSSFTRLHFSEAAYYQNAEAVIYGALQAGSPIWVVAESTANGAQGWFYHETMAALDGRSDWTVHFYPWWTEPTYAIDLHPDEALDYSDEELDLIKKHGLNAAQIKWRRTKIRQIKHLFPQEFPEDVRRCFLTSGVGYFGDIEHCYTAPLNAEYQQGHWYVAGIDWGQMEDSTVLSIGDVNTRQQVALFKINRLPYPEIRARIIALLNHWNVQQVVAELNSASGNVDSLRTEAYAAGWGGSVIGYNTTNPGKAVDMNLLREALQGGDLFLLPVDEQKAQMDSLQVNQTANNSWQIAAIKGQHDDIPIANMLMFKAMAGMYSLPDNLEVKTF